MGRVFKDISKQYLWKRLLNGQSPIEFSELGRWWGKAPSRSDFKWTFPRNCEGTEQLRKIL
ncbi:MAG: DUF234 domain-containing protein [Clostridiales bacterium]|nr:DUF234 domain-containing protein [Clostridiales bacterium]